MIEGQTVIKVHRGIAGQVVIDAMRDGMRVSFSGSTYGAPGPVVMITETGAQVFVSDPGRFGEKFGTDWVRAFVGAA